MIIEGIIRKKDVLGDNNNIYHLPVRGITKNGYKEVLIDAEGVGGDGSFSRQSVEHYIGMRVEFVVSPTGYGYNYKVLDQNINDINTECLYYDTEGKCKKDNLVFKKDSNGIVEPNCYQCIKDLETLLQFIK